MPHWKSLVSACLPGLFALGLLGFTEPRPPEVPRWEPLCTASQMVITPTDHVHFIRKPPLTITTFAISTECTKFTPRLVQPDQ